MVSFEINVLLELVRKRGVAFFFSIGGMKMSENVRDFGKNKIKYASLLIRFLILLNFYPSSVFFHVINQHQGLTTRAAFGLESM